MATIEYEGRSHESLPSETVLEVLIRCGSEIPHSCRSGSCGTCMMRVREGQVSERSRAGLKDSWKAQGYFLPCVCPAESNLKIGRPADEVRVGATIAGLTLLSPDVLEVRLRCDHAIGFRPGQFITLFREDGVGRSYSIASLPEDGDIELHVRRIAGGKISTWLHTEASLGTRVSLLGPLGDCFYVEGNGDEPLLLAGTGTGLAPLYGILKDALRHQHRGPIHLFHGAVHRGGLYLVEELKKLASAHPHVRYTPALLSSDGAEDATTGPIDTVISRHIPKLSGWRGYVCGDPAIVQKLRKRFFLSGMASRDIHYDAFVPAASG